MAKIRLKDSEFEATFAQCVAVVSVLLEHLVEMGSAELDGGEAVGEIAARNADDGTGKQAQGSGCVNGVQGIQYIVCELRSDSALNLLSRRKYFRAA